MGIQIADGGCPGLKVGGLLGTVSGVWFSRTDMALDSAESGIAIAQHAGDDCDSRHSHQPAQKLAALAGQYDAALGWLAHAITSFRDCSDTHGGPTLCCAGNASFGMLQMMRDAPERDPTPCCNLYRDHDYAFLFQRRTPDGGYLIRAG